MAALAYLLLPVTGLLAYMSGTTVRERWHGLQAIALGLVWPCALYAGSWLSPSVTQVVFVVGAGAWLLFLFGTLAGKDPAIPVIGRVQEVWE